MGLRFGQIRKNCNALLSVSIDQSNQTGLGFAEMVQAILSLPLEPEPNGRQGNIKQLTLFIPWQIKRHHCKARAILARAQQANADTDINDDKDEATYLAQAQTLRDNWLKTNDAAIQLLRARFGSNFKILQDSDISTTKSFAEALGKVRGYRPAKEEQNKNGKGKNKDNNDKGRNFDRDIKRLANDYVDNKLLKTEEGLPIETSADTRKKILAAMDDYNVDQCALNVVMSSDQIANYHHEFYRGPSRSRAQTTAINEFGVSERMAFTSIQETRDCARVIALHENDSQPLWICRADEKREISDAALTAAFKEDRTLFELRVSAVKLTDIISNLLQHQPKDKPYVLVAHGKADAAHALQIARELEKKGKMVERLVILNAVAPTLQQSGNFKLKCKVDFFYTGSFQKSNLKELEDDETDLTFGWGKYCENDSLATQKRIKGDDATLMKEYVAEWATPLQRVLNGEASPTLQSTRAPAPPLDLSQLQQLIAAQVREQLKNLKHDEKQEHTGRSPTASPRSKSSISSSNEGEPYSPLSSSGEQSPEQRPGSADLSGEHSPRQQPSAAAVAASHQKGALRPQPTAQPKATSAAAVVASSGFMPAPESPRATAPRSASAPSSPTRGKLLVVVPQPRPFLP